MWPLPHLAVWFLLLQLSRPSRICKSVNVRNSPSNLTQLAGCSVVEGYVQIVLIERANETDFEPWSFPELREITQYLLFYRVKGLRNIGQLFPNLVRIGGASLFIDYGLVVHEMFSLQEIGLRNLKEVSRGSIIVTKNPSLCYVNTINWEMIARWDPVKNYVAKNKDPQACPGCLGNCAQGLCWSQTDCQIQPETAKCDPLCVGGCTSPGPRGCYACSRVLTADNTCVQNCPAGTYEYLNRRCVTRQQCLSTELPKDTFGGLRFLSSTERVKNFVVFNGTCTDICPPGYRFDAAGTGCTPCKHGKCQKWCPGMSIENIGDAQVLRGCTHIQGSLEISIRTGKPKIVFEELEDSLGSIEEIESYLKVVRSFPIVNLNFLKNLTTIHGIYSDAGFGDNYSLLVLENQNIQELWDWDLKPNFKILNGKVFFHYNPKLCLQHIHRLLSIIQHDKNVSNLEIGKDSNGDKFPCNATEIDVTITYRSFNTIQINVPYVQINYDTTILRYVIYFIKDPYRNITMFDELDQCSDYGWRTKDISVDPNDYDFVKNGFKVNLTELEPNTQYAFYVTTYTVDRFGAKSPMYYETTFPTTPSELTRLVAFSNKSSEITLHWEPPKNVNGKLQEYIVTWSLLQTDKTTLNLRNYCEYPMTYFREESPKPLVYEDDDKVDRCCVNVKKHIPKDGFENLCSNYDHCPFSSLNADRDIPMSCESCFYSYIYKKPFQADDVNFDSILNNNTFKLNKSRRNFPQRPKVFTANLPGNSSEFTITDVLHFRQYLVTVRACRELHPEEFDRSDENRCSKTDIVTIRTLKDDHADRIPGISYEVINGTAFVFWETPSNPNHVVVAFEIEHQHQDSVNTNPIPDCFSHSEYETSKGRFSIVGLAPGGYQVRVRAVSLAGRGPFTKYVYFNITNEVFSVFDILFVVIFFCIVIFLFSVGFTIYHKKKHALEILVTTVNPDYQYVQDHWEISRADVELKRELGSGSFGKVYEGTLKTTNTPCAVKTVNDDASQYDTYVFLSEASIMKSVSDAYHIVGLLGVVSMGRPPLVVMELMSLGDLKTYLRSTREFQPPSTATMISMALQIADGMTFMEAKKYVHRDLAARNCMVSKDCVVKVGDFGMTRDVYETDYYRKNNAGLLPIRWMAPESLKDGIFTSQSDVWSFGVVLWEIVTLAEQPYQGSSNDQVLQEVMDGRKLDIPISSPEALKATMTSSWKKKPTQRMTFMQIVTSLDYYHDEEFKRVSYYHSQEAVDLRKTSSDYMEMRSVEEPLLGDFLPQQEDPPKTGSVAVLLSKVKSFSRGERLSRIEEGGSSIEDQI